MTLKHLKNYLRFCSDFPSLWLKTLIHYFLKKILQVLMLWNWFSCSWMKITQSWWQGKLSEGRFVISFEFVIRYDLFIVPLTPHVCEIILFFIFLKGSHFERLLVKRISKLIERTTIWLRCYFVMSYGENFQRIDWRIAHLRSLLLFWEWNYYHRSD